MAYDFSTFKDAGLSEEFVSWLVCEEWPRMSRRFNRLWEYYQNPRIDRTGSAVPDSGRTYLQAQEIGLPGRITGRVYTESDDVGFGRPSECSRKEVVIENDIAWRVNAMVDFLVGKGIQIVSSARSEQRRRNIQQVLKAVIEANGGAMFFQDLAVLGSVYGFVDCLVRWPAEGLAGRDPYGTSESTSFSTSLLTSSDSVLRTARGIVLELIEADRALPVLEEHDYKRIRCYVQHFMQSRNAIAEEGAAVALRSSGRSALRLARKMLAVTEIVGREAWQRYEDGELVAEGPNPLGRVPVVHVQNLSQPGFYEGLSDVEQLIGLQDELNTRLSDRASRVTMQCCKMYLAKGIDEIKEKRIAPGAVWGTWNENAELQVIGGDSANPSEDQHISEIREAMDKISGVTPVVAGVLKNKLGNLSSAVALKMTFMGMLSKSYRKQLTYGQGIRQICAMVLEMLDKSGVFKTTPEERQVDVVFANPLAEGESE